MKALVLLNEGAGTLADGIEPADAQRRIAQEFADRADKEMQVKVGLTLDKLMADFNKSAGGK